MCDPFPLLYVSIFIILGQLAMRRDIILVQHHALDQKLPFSSKMHMVLAK